MLAEASSDQNALLQALTMLRTELKDFKQGMRCDLDEFKNDVKKVLKEDLLEFKGEVMQELQSQTTNIAEAQTRIADMELACLEMKETLLAVVKENSQMRDKVIDLESRSRRNNMRIYGVLEEKEGRSVMEFVNELFKRHLTLPEGLELRIQPAHKASIPKSPAVSSPRSIIVNFLEFHVKELVSRKAWQQKIEINGKRLYFDNNYAIDIREKRKAYEPIEAALTEKGIQYQTPYRKMRVYWNTSLVIYSTAETCSTRPESTWTQGESDNKSKHRSSDAQERLNAVLPWKRALSKVARERLSEFRRDTDQQNCNG